MSKKGFPGDEEATGLSGQGIQWVAEEDAKVKWNKVELHNE